jgi:predicted RNA-binding Zn-ribbon protein involved in translation (DUF1610 family)
MIIISPNDRRCTDELTTEFYDCPKCGYERVPKGSLKTFDLEEYPEIAAYDAKFCPGCGEEIKWE